MASIFIWILAFSGAAVGGIALAMLAKWFFWKRMKKSLFAALCVVLSLLLCGGICLVWLNSYYKVEDWAVQALEQQSDVKISQIDGGLFFDGSGDETALVFYPGGKVDTNAYALLMKEIAQGGVDCFLLDVPFHLAILDTNAADKVTKKYDYKHWLSGGHSMGGVAASSYAVSHDEVQGLVMLASFPSAKLPERLKLLTVYGGNDKVMNRDAYNNSRQFFPKDSTELEVSGGNHAGFGNYGAQEGDGAAEISSSEQQRQTAEAVLQMSRSLF